MSYESRQKKRRHKRVERKRRRTPETARRWFLMLSKKPGRFDCCGTRFERGADIVFRFEPRSVHCQRCADRAGIKYRLSLRWERARRVPKAVA
jgi:hypothetical protein